MSTKKAALYIRLSREDGDKAESLSVINQKLKLSEYAKNLSEISDTEYYIDDGYTGTSFNRPAFEKMCRDIESGTISIVVVKDLSRLGRNMAKVTELVQEYFPQKKIRFIAIDDHIDKQFFEIDTSEDMVIDLKNMFNGFYPKDISKKVRSTFRTKQQAGQFIGAFACYGYKKSPDNHNQLVVDEPAAKIVRKIFALYMAGYGQNTIARMLNNAHIPCPSEYKKRCGLNYRNCRRLEDTTYWTYSSIRNILRNRIYTGTMVQNKAFRQICQNRAMALPEEQWIIVPGTHEPIIDEELFCKVQELLSQNTRHAGFNQNIHIFAGLLKCGDCGRAMVKITRKGETTFSCGSYNRYGKSHCSAHNIKEKVIEETVQKDFEKLLASIPDLKEIIEKEQKKITTSNTDTTRNAIHLKEEMQKIVRKKERIYDDYLEELISKGEYIKFKEKYQQMISLLQNQIDELSAPENNLSPANKWLEHLLTPEHPKTLDRETVVELVHKIYIYEDHQIKIVYNFDKF